MSAQLNRSLPFSIPLLAAQWLGRLGDIVPGSPVNSAVISKMTEDLTFDDTRARQALGWQPRRVTEHFIIS
jgi:hypothetical protein